MTCNDLAPGPGCTPALPTARTARPYGRFWDREDKQVLGPIDTTPPFARYRSALILGEWGIPAGDAEMIVAELVANAVQATQRASLETPISLRLLAGQGRLVIEVGDQAPGIPAVQDVTTASESGRGLFLVATFSTQWGWYAHNEWKIVYATMRL